MKSPSQPPSDDEIDRLLAARLRRTSPEFELRWRELRGSFRSSPALRTRIWPRWLLWPGLATAAVAVVVVTVNLRHRPVGPAPAAEFAQLLALDAALAPAAPLLEPETRDAVLHLPVNR